MSLYRKYRPQAFSDVVGQDHIVTTLENAIQQDKLTHAYLFAGSRGTGKTSVARILAKHILTKGITDEVLRRQIERGVVDGSIVDLIEIDGASNRRIEDSRDLVEKIQFSPVVTMAKVYIIDEVHMLTKEAFNALLKTLEEPPNYAFFILATTELQKIPATIQSRCQRFSFHQIREEDLVRRLQYIADQEHIVVDRAALRAIAHHAQGGLRDAISLLDQLRSLEKISLTDVQEHLGESGQERVETLLQAVEEGNRKEVLHIIQQIEEAGIPLDTFVRQLLTGVRDRLHEAVTAHQSTVSLVRTLDTLLIAIRDIRATPVPGLVLESALLSLCGTSEEAPAAPKKDRTAKKVKEEPTIIEPEKQPLPPKKETLIETTERAKEEALSQNAIIEAPEVTLQSVLAVWPQILQKATPAALRQSLKNGRVVQVAEKNVLVRFSSNFHRDRVAQREALHTIELLLQEHFKRMLKLECTLEEENAIPLSDSNMVNLAEAVSEIF
jgi:DNA polymerase-3 subunit gamma/tau